MTLVRIAVLLLLTSAAVAQTCNFATSGTTMTLKNDCVASGTITIPDGFTLNGNNHLISIPDSGSGLFSAGVLTNGGAVASVKNLTIQTVPAGSCTSSFTSNAIFFTSTSGSITGNTLINVGDWNCVAGNSGITLISPVNVTISGNRIYNVNGPALSVTCLTWPNCSGGAVNISGNEFSTSYCCNAVVYLSGVSGSFTNNALNALLVYQIALRLDNTAAGFKVASNNINLVNGAANQYGVYVASDGAIVTNNRVFNQGFTPSEAVGIYNAGATNPATNKITGNQIRCYGTPVVNVTGSNVFLTCPW